MTMPDVKSHVTKETKKALLGLEMGSLPHTSYSLRHCSFRLLFRSMQNRLSGERFTKDTDI